MPQIASPEIGKRMYEECLRLFAGHKDTINHLRCGSGEPYCWMRGVAPSSIYLQRILLCGGDITYILIGRRSNAVPKV